MASYEEAYSLISIIEKIKGWHHDRNLIQGSTDKDQYLKLIQEAGELSDNICKGNDIADDIGDMIVVLINIAERNNLTLTECVLQAWNDIKDRKGMMVDGVFVKEADGLVPAARTEESTSSHYQEDWEYALNEYYYTGDGTPVEYQDDYIPKIKVEMVEDAPSKRAVGSLDGPQCDWDLENDPEYSKEPDQIHGIYGDIYKNTASGTTKY